MGGDAESQPEEATTAESRSAHVSDDSLHCPAIAPLQNKNKKVLLSGSCKNGGRQGSWPAATRGVQGVRKVLSLVGQLNLEDSVAQTPPPSAQPLVGRQRR